MQVLYSLHVPNICLHKQLLKESNWCLQISVMDVHRKKSTYLHLNDDFVLRATNLVGAYFN